MDDDDEDVMTVMMSYIAGFQHLTLVTYSMYVCNVTVTPHCQTSWTNKAGKTEIKKNPSHYSFTRSSSSPSLPLLHVNPSLLSVTENPEALCNPIRTLFREIKLNKLM